MIRSIVVVVACVLGAGCAAEEDDAQREHSGTWFARLQGAWTVTSAERAIVTAGAPCNALPDGESVRAELAGSYWKETDDRGTTRTSAETVTIADASQDGAELVTTIEEHHDDETTTRVVRSFWVTSTAPEKMGGRTRVIITAGGATCEAAYASLAER